MTLCAEISNQFLFQRIEDGRLFEGALIRVCRLIEALRYINEEDLKLF